MPRTERASRAPSTEHDAHASQGEVQGTVLGVPGARAQPGLGHAKRRPSHIWRRMDLTVVCDAQSACWHPTCTVVRGARRRPPRRVARESPSREANRRHRDSDAVQEVVHTGRSRGARRYEAALRHRPLSGIHGGIHSPSHSARFQSSLRVTPLLCRQRRQRAEEEEEESAAQLP